MYQYKKFYRNNSGNGKSNLRVAVYKITDKIPDQIRRGVAPVDIFVTSHWRGIDSSPKKIAEFLKQYNIIY